MSQAFLVISQVVFGYLRKVVGYLRYKDPEGLNLMVYLVPSLFGFAGVIVIIILLVCLRYRKPQKNAEREYKAIQLQLDNLESTVRNECKQGKGLSFNQPTQLGNMLN